MNRTLTHACSAVPIRLIIGLFALGMFASTATPVAAQASDQGREIKLPEQWSFRLDREEVGQEQRWFERDVARGLSWQKVAVTAPWGPGGDQLDGDYRGVAWYWTPFEAPKLDDGEHLWLEVGQIKGSATVYINSEEIATENTPLRIDAQYQDDTAGDEDARAKAGERPRRYDITAQVQPGENDVMIRVESRSGAGGITRPALLRRTPPNYISDPRFTFGLNTWRLYINDDNDRRIEPAFGPGYYFGEQCVRIKAEPNQLVVLDHRAEAILRKGKSYRLSVRYRQQLDAPPADNVTPLRLMWMTYPERPPRQPHDKLWVAGPRESTAGWAELTGIFEAKENYTGFRVGVLINSPGVYDVAEFSVSPVAATGESKE